MATIEVDNLQKTYPDGTEAVRGVSFEVHDGEFFGFLGPNGAGKSTTIKILVTLIAKTSGAVTVNGYAVGKDDREIRETIGYAAQDVGVDEDLTGRENLILSGRLYHMSQKEAAHRATELLEIIDLVDAADRRAGNYSGGMRRRLDLAQALMHRPRLLFLDEPTTGLDPQNRRALWDELERFNKSGTTMFLTTQYMEEADQLCDRLAVIDHGLIVAAGTPESLKASLGGEVLTLTFPTIATEQLSALIAKTAGVLRAVPGVGEVKEAERSVVGHLDGRPGDVLPAVFAALESGDVEARVAVSPPTLDDVFLSVTGHELREEEGRPTRRMPWGGRRRRR